MLINISFQEKVLNAGSGGRTHTVSPPRDFESVSQFGITRQFAAILGNSCPKMRCLKGAIQFKSQFCVVSKISENSEKKSVLVEIR